MFIFEILWTWLQQWCEKPAHLWNEYVFTTNPQSMNNTDIYCVWLKYLLLFFSVIHAILKQLADRNGLPYYFCWSTHFTSSCCSSSAIRPPTLIQQQEMNSEAYWLIAEPGSWFPPGHSVPKFSNLIKIDPLDSTWHSCKRTI